MVPKSARAHSAVTLVCQYDLDGKPLYAVKWYRGNHEFFRYVPQESPSMVAFPVPGLVVDVDQQWIRELEPGLVSLSLSALKDPSPDVSSLENKSKLQQLNHKQYKHYKPVWIRCEAYVKGRYLMSSPSVPIIPDFHSDRPHEGELCPWSTIFWHNFTSIFT
ncbi:unnamed protein product [Nesidiocoris tenuis]|uniref:Ig-like domain-containing protein n=1 Tax=Nesidiocoris tenuis TaxID=355587 RepID=A0A6H5FZ00_9HEMI|nr:unnamed protein product [Nesidiocoris tenuis]